MIYRRGVVVKGFAVSQISIVSEPSMYLQPKPLLAYYHEILGLLNPRSHPCSGSHKLMELLNHNNVG